MVALKDPFTTDIGLLSLGVLVFIVGMAAWFARFFLVHIREELEATKAAGSAPPRRTR